jgi:hypothetical protein
MPTISIFFGFLVQMYWRDHPPPHVHVFYQGFEALIAIETGEVILGSLPPGALRLIRPWIERRRADLMTNWERGRLRQPFERIPGADVE